MILGLNYQKYCFLHKIFLISSLIYIFVKRKIVYKNNLNIKYDNTMRLEHNIFRLILFSVIYCCFPFVILSQTNFRNISTTDGLSSNYINSIYRDSRGFLWAGTNFGLNRYDGYRVKNFYQNPQNENSLINNYVDDISEDYSGLIWIKTRGGFVVYNPNKELFDRDVKELLSKRDIKYDKLNFIVNKGCLSGYITNDSLAYIYNFESSLSLNCRLNSIILAASFDSKSYLWLIDTNFKLYKIDANDGSLVSVYDYKYDKDYKLASLFVDSSGGVWIIINRTTLFHFDPALLHWTKIDKKIFSGCPVTSISQVGKTIYVGTDHGGIFKKDVFDADKCSFTPIHQSDDLYYNSITCMFSDEDNTLWIGNYKTGIDYTNKSFEMFKTNTVLKNKNNDINCFLKDNEGNLWIGTNENGLYIKDHLTSELRKFNYNDKERGTIVSLCMDSLKRIWIGTYLDGLYCVDGKKVIDYSKNSELGNSIWSMCVDNEGKLWVGTLHNGLFYLDEKKSLFIGAKDHHRLNGTIEHIYRDKRGKLIVCGTYGFFLIDNKGSIERHIMFLRPEDSISDKQYINYIVQDDRDFYWVSTQSGLAVFDKDFKNYRFLSKEDGLGNMFVYTTLIDNNGDIWASTSKGIYKVNIKNCDKGIDEFIFNVQYFNSKNDFQDNIFNPKSGYSIDEGRTLLFGGINGYNEIIPSMLKKLSIKNNLLITDLYVNNILYENNESCISNTCDDIKLEYNENNIRLNLSSLNLLYPLNSVFEYRLKGVDKYWNLIHGGLPYIEYNNLPSGDYVLDIRLKSETDSDLLQSRSLNIRVLPPIWMTWQAYLLYIVLVLLLVLYIVHNFVKQTKLHYNLEKEKSLSKYKEELSNARITFFTNLSHELRTPVSLIISPIENIIAKEPEWAAKNNIHMVLRNAKRLLFLVNQLLDFRKIEVNEIQFNPLYGDIVSFVRDRAFSFKDIANNKNIEFTFNSNVSEYYMNFEPNKMEQIIFNLLSNSFKYTASSGFIRISTFYDESNEMFKIAVEDSGMGLDKEEIDHIFEPFYQAENHKDIKSCGTGIGLSIVKSFVELHNGIIDVESTKGVKTVFTLSFKNKNTTYHKETLNESLNIKEFNNISLNNAPKDKTVLVVDDNDDFRYYLVSSLSDYYNVIDATNGEDAMKKIKTYHPDIIVSDVMMPIVDGLELCRMVKDDPQLCHLPFLLITASESEANKVNAYQYKTNAYLTKPFSIDVLKARILNLLTEQENNNKVINSNESIIRSSVTVNSNDEKLLNQVVRITEEKMDDVEFSINYLSKEIGISSVYLNKKITQITGKTTSEYVRYLRMRRAGDLLLKTQKSISEIAYEVGYSIPKYFSKHFKEEFGILPSEYRKHVK